MGGAVRKISRNSSLRRLDQASARLTGSAMPAWLGDRFVIATVTKRALPNRLESPPSPVDLPVAGRARAATVVLAICGGPHDPVLPGEGTLDPSFVQSSDIPRQERIMSKDQLPDPDAQGEGVPKAPRKLQDEVQPKRRDTEPDSPPAAPGR
jgi:hypothetical protein